LTLKEKVHLLFLASQPPLVAPLDTVAGLRDRGALATSQPYILAIGEQAKSLLGVQIFG
jgi:hypothetical protein